MTDKTATRPDAPLRPATLPEWDDDKHSKAATVDIHPRPVIPAAESNLADSFIFNISIWFVVLAVFGFFGGFALGSEGGGTFCWGVALLCVVLAILTYAADEARFVAQNRRNRRR